MENTIKEREKAEAARQQSLRKRIAVITTDESAGKSGSFTMDPTTGKRKPFISTVVDQTKDKES